MSRLRRGYVADRPGALVWAMRLLLVVTAVFWVSYVAAANLFLWTGARHIVSPAKLDFERAYTLFPGYYRFRALSLESADGARPWRLSLSRASMHLELGELWSGRVPLTHFEGHGLVFEVEGDEGSLRLEGGLHAKGEEAEGKVVVAIEGGDLALRRKELAKGAPAVNALQGVLSGELVLGDVDVREGAARVEGGRFSLLDTGLQRMDGRRAVDLRARLEITGGRISLEEGLLLRGDIDVEGEDGGVLFDLLGASETLRWMFSLIEGEPFRLHARVLRRPGEIDLRDVEATSGALVLRGALRRGSGTEGALLLRAGRSSAGVVLSDGGMKVIQAPKEGWLKEMLR